MRISMWALVLAFALDCKAQTLDITQHILAGGDVGKTQMSLSLNARQGGIKWMPVTGGHVGAARSKGLYQIAGQPVGEIVAQLYSGIVVGQAIDIPLIAKHHLPENQPKLEPGAAAPTRPNLDTKLVVEEIKKVLSAKFGAPFIEYSKPGEKGISNCSVAVWRSQQNSRGVSWRLTTFYANDETYLTGDAPHFCRLSLSFTPDLESVLFDPAVFFLRDYELLDRLLMVGLKLDQNSPGSTKVLGAEATVRVNVNLNRLQGLEIAFSENPKSPAIVLKKYTDPFLNAANTVITSRVRSFPIELTRKNTNYAARDYLLYDPATDTAYAYHDVFAFTATEVMLVWSPGRGVANYRLSGKTLEVLPPGWNVAKAIDPTLGTLTGGDTISGSVMGRDFNLPILSFAEFQKNIIKDKTGVWLDIPMENQGDLPLCLPASMARILRYFGKQVNQFSVAKVGGVGMRGTSWPAMVSIISSCSEKFGLKRMIYTPKANLGAIVKANIDNGIPILWLIPEHARIINGYNAQTNSILYTDSWGAGFEVRSMPYAEAAALTEYMFVFVPPSAIK